MTQAVVTLLCVIKQSTNSVREPNFNSRDQSNSVVLVTYQLNHPKASTRFNYQHSTKPTFNSLVWRWTRSQQLFQSIPLHGQIENDIHNAFRLSGGDPSTLPKLLSSVGDNVDFMIGIKYLRHHPKIIFQLTSGLTIYESIFQNPDGNRGIIGGPHEIFTMIEQQFRGSGKSTFFSNQLTLFKSGFSVNPDVPLLCTKNTIQVGLKKQKQPVVQSPTDA